MEIEDRQKKVMSLKIDSINTNSIKTNRGVTAMETINEVNTITSEKKVNVDVMEKIQKDLFPALDLKYQSILTTLIDKRNKLYSLITINELPVETIKETDECLLDITEVFKKVSGLDKKLQSNYESEVTGLSNEFSSYVDKKTDEINLKTKSEITEIISSVMARLKKK